MPFNKISAEDLFCHEPSTCSRKEGDEINVSKFDATEIVAGRGYR